MSRKSPCGNPRNEKQIMSDFNSSFSKGKLNGMPMEKLVVSKEVNSEPDVPNLVAKLMGLDSLPLQEPDTFMRRSLSRGNPRTLSDNPGNYRQQSMKSTHEGSCEETIKDKKITLVRQKFIEAKRMTLDKKLRQSNQFQDALEVLSTNRELFLRCLQDSNSVLYHHSYKKQSVSPSPGRKQITILSPSMMPNIHKLSGAGEKHYESSTQPTRIVVLKPGPGKLLDLKAAAPQSEVQRVLHSEGFLEDVEDESEKSREDAMIIDQLHDTLGRDTRNGTLNSFAVSLGYVGDQSLFSTSEIDCADGHISNSDVMPSESRHSWDGGDRIGSPSSPAFSRASSSPKLSVSREAKRRLSERWVKVSLNGSQEPKDSHGRSITLLEMLALSKIKEAASSEEICSSQQLKSSNSLLVTEVRQDENVGCSSRNFLRTKSVPASSREFDYTLNMDNLFLDKGKVKATKEETKTSAKSSFRGKISSLFFSRNKKPGKDKCIASKTNNEVRLSTGVETGNLGDEQSNIASLALLEPSNKTSSSSLTHDHGKPLLETVLAVAEVESGKPGKNLDHPSPVSVLDPPLDEDEHTRNAILHDELDLLGAEPPLHLIGSNLIDRSPLIGSVTRTCPINNSGVESPVPSKGSNLIDNSPLVGSSARTCAISVVEPPLHSLGSNLIDKSPLLGSVAHTRSGNNSCDPKSSHLSWETISVQKTYEEKEWKLFVQTLLSAADLDDEVQSTSLLARWHIPESPLDPTLRDKYMDDAKDKEARDEATCKQKQMTQMLVFDCVNALLLEIAGDLLSSGLRTNNDIWEENSILLIDEVWARMKDMLSVGIRCVLDDCGDGDNYLALERVMRNEVAGKLWVEQLRLETDSLGKEIADELVGELVQEMWVH